MNRVTFQGKFISETKTLIFDFLSLLALGESISTTSVSAAVYSGTDSSPSSLISGAAAVSGSKVTQKITGGVVGVVYLVTCSVTTSTGQTLKQSGYQVVL